MTKILVVCLGNICRSPLAEGILQSRLPNHFTVDSAGTISMHEGCHPDQRAIRIGQRYGVDISLQQSRPIVAADFQGYDHIYCMDISVYQKVQSLAGNDAERRKVKLFLEEAGYTKGHNEVPDPYWGTLADFDEVYHLLVDASDKIAEKFRTESQK